MKKIARYILLIIFTTILPVFAFIIWTMDDDETFLNSFVTAWNEFVTVLGIKK